MMEALMVGVRGRKIRGREAGYAAATPRVDGVVSVSLSKQTHGLGERAVVRRQRR